MAKQLYHLGNIRDFLTKGFNDLDLRRLCYDVPNFRPVYDELAQGTGKARIVDLLIEHAEKTVQIDTLLALAKDRNPKRYDKHGPYYIDDPTAALQRQVSDLAQRLAAITAPTSLTPEQQYQIAVHWVELGRKDSLRGFQLPGADLRAVDLRRSNLCVANLRQANLRSADLSYAKLIEADLAEADLSGVKLNAADLTRANLRTANLTRAWLVDANLTEANLTRADLTGAVLVNDLDRRFDGATTTPAQADLSFVDLTEANLTDAQVTKEQLESVQSLRGVTMPDGSWHG